MSYRNYKGRIGGINHWLFAQDDFKHTISRSFRGEEYDNVINGSGAVRGEQKFPMGYQDVLIPELARRAEFFKDIPALKNVNSADAKVLTVLVGDKDAVLPQLEEAGFPAPKMLDEEGRPQS